MLLGPLLNRKKCRQPSHRRQQQQQQQHQLCCDREEDGFMLVCSEPTTETCCALLTNDRPPSYEESMSGAGQCPPAYQSLSRARTTSSLAPGMVSTLPLPGVPLQQLVGHSSAEASCQTRGRRGPGHQDLVGHSSAGASCQTGGPGHQDLVGHSSAGASCQTGGRGGPGRQTTLANFSSMSVLVRDVPFRLCPELIERTQTIETVHRLLEGMAAELTKHFGRRDRRPPPPSYIYDFSYEAGLLREMQSQAPSTSAAQQ